MPWRLLRGARYVSQARGCQIRRLSRCCPSISPEVVLSSPGGCEKPLGGVVPGRLQGRRLSPLVFARGSSHARRRSAGGSRLAGCEKTAGRGLQNLTHRVNTRGSVSKCEPQRARARSTTRARGREVLKAPPGPDGACKSLKCSCHGRPELKCGGDGSLPFSSRREAVVRRTQ